MPTNELPQSAPSFPTVTEMLMQDTPEAQALWSSLRDPNHVPAHQIEGTPENLFVNRIAESTARVKAREAKPLSTKARVIKYGLKVPAIGTSAIIANLVGSKILGARHAGFEFRGGQGQVNYLLAGMALSPGIIGIRELRERAKRLYEGHAAVTLMAGIVGFAVEIGLTAAMGATGAAIARARHQDAQDPAHAAAAAAVAGAVIGGGITLIALGLSWAVKRCSTENRSQAVSYPLTAV